MEKVFVTGSAGFVGGHLVDELLKKYTVIGIDNMTSGLQKTLESHIVHENFIPALYDVTDPKIERIFSYHNREVTRLIRVGFGPFSLQGLAVGKLKKINLANYEQLGYFK